MDIITLLIILILIIGFGIVFFLLSHPKVDPTLVEWLHTMSGQVAETKTSVNESLANSTRDIHDRLLQATAVISDLKKEAGAFSEVSRSMKDLHEFLRSPKLRGNIGESVLRDLISQMFPASSFHLQYAFKSGEKVDAAILTDAGILPIDSKFPMENFLRISQHDPVGADPRVGPNPRNAFIRDIKKHVTDIATKYILPEEGTLDFALMYIPSESVFYELVGADDLMAFARQNRVYPVSPNTMYAALQTILLSFEGKKIESRAKEVFKMLRAIEKDYEKTSNNLSTLGNHLTNAYNKFGEVQNSLQLVGQKLSSTHTLELELTSKDKKLIKN